MSRFNRDCLCGCDEDLVQLAKNLTLHDLAWLIECFQEKIEVYIGKTGNCGISSELSFEHPVCMNGPSIQLNLRLADLDDLKEDKFFAEAVKDKDPTSAN